jgi:hypothetical protein
MHAQRPKRDFLSASEMDCEQINSVPLFNDNIDTRTRPIILIISRFEEKVISSGIFAPSPDAVRL